jgi:Flp pilus assembly protein TadG
LEDQVDLVMRRTSLAADTRGNSVVELALVAPILATFLLGMTDLSRAVAERLRLEQAAQRSIERVMQGQESSSTFANLAADAAAEAGVAVGNVTVTPRLECNGTTTASGAAYAAATCTGTQIAAGYVTVSVTKNFQPMFGTRFFPGANANGTFTLTGVAGVRVK